MKICLINNLYKPLDKGGAERIVELWHDSLSAQGHEIRVIATKPRGGKKFIPAKNAVYLYSFYSRLDGLPKFLRLVWHVGNLFNIRKYFRLKKILAGGKFDLVITNNIVGLGALLPLAVRQTGAKHIHYLHDIQLIHPSGLLLYGQEKIIDGWPARVYAYFNRLFFGCVEKVISPSHWLLAMHTGKNFFAEADKKVMPSPVKLPAMDTNNGKPASKKNFTIGYIGQIEKHKGVLDLIHVLGGIAAMDKKIAYQLHVIGSGSLSGQARQSAGKNVIFMGKIPRGDMPRFFRAIDLLVVPSLCYENSPTVIYEAVAAGTPFLAADIGGAPELVGIFHGSKFRAGDKADMAEKIMAIAQNYEKYKNIAIANKKNLPVFHPENYWEDFWQFVNS